MKYYLRSQRRKELEEMDTMIQGAGQVKILPTDIIDQILDYCSFKEILCLSTVNKFWNHYIKTSRKCMDKIQLKITEKNYKYISRCTRDYYNIKLDTIIPMRKEVASRVLKKFSVVKCIYIHIDCVFDYLPQLRELTFYHRNFSNIPADIDMNDFFHIDAKNEGQWMTENVKQIINTYSSQLEIIRMALGHELNIYAVTTLINLRGVDIMCCCFNVDNDTRDYKINPSVTALEIGYSVGCLHAFPNLRYLKVKHLSFEMIKLIFEQLHKMEIAVYGDLNYRDICYDHNINLFKKRIIQHDNYDIDKENKRNVKLLSHSSKYYKQWDAYFNFYTK